MAMAAPQVTLHDKLSGRNARFFLDGQGRVAVGTVLLALGARMVKLDDGNGDFSVLEPDPCDGKSLNVFHPNQVVDVDLVPTGAPQAQAGSSLFDSAFGSGPAQPRRWYDVDLPLYLSCELVDELDLELHVSTRVYTWEEFKSGGKYTGRDDDPQVTLVKYDPPSCLGCPEDEGWNELHTGLERKEHMKKIDSWLGLPSDAELGWLSQGSKASVTGVFDNSILIRSKNNEVLAYSSVETGAVLGVNIYKRLSWSAILRSHLEFVLWGVTSNVPYVQLLTDMKTGGLFCVCKDVDPNRRSVLWIVVMRCMDEVEEAIKHLGSNLPKSRKHFKQPELPHGAKFPYEGAKRTTVMRV